MKIKKGADLISAFSFQFSALPAPGDGGGAVVRGLGGGVDDGGGPEFFEQVEQALAVADVELVVGEGGAELCGEARLVPAGT